jgi:hypothetical protein
MKNLGTFEGLGPLGIIGSKEYALKEFTKVFSSGLGVLTVSAGIWFIIQIGAGAFQWLSSAGEKDALQKAQKKISNAIFGLFVVIFSYALIYIVGYIFGINILNPVGALWKLFFPEDGTTYL